MKTCLSILVLVAFAAFAAERTKPVGSATLTVSTKATKSKYAPKHVLAIWVTDAKGKFVKTLKVCGKKRRKYLKIWAANSKQNTVDAISSATLKKHQAHRVTWDCCDAKGKLVPDGTYHIHAEFTEKNGQGPVMPLRHVKFTKGAKGVSFAPKDTPNFIKIKLDYQPTEKPKPAAKPATKKK